MTGDEMVGWHHQLDGHESEQTPGWRRTRKPGMLQFTQTPKQKANRPFCNGGVVTCQEMFVSF